MSPIRLIALTLFSCLLALPAFGYIVFLKDGSQLQTKEKYRIQGDKAYLTLPSGTETFISATEIDIAKTDEVNTVSYGTATLIEGGEAQQLATEVRFEKEEETLADLARERRDLANNSQAEPEVVVDESAADDLPRTLAGYVDLSSLPRRDFENDDIRSEITRYLTSQGVDRVGIYQGTTPSQPLLEIVVNSEGMVFQALKESANVLIQVHDRFPEQVDAVDLLMLTENQQRAGQFTLRAEQAKLLAVGAVTPEDFFLRHVEF